MPVINATVGFTRALGAGGDRAPCIGLFINRPMAGEDIGRLLFRLAQLESAAVLR